MNLKRGGRDDCAGVGLCSEAARSVVCDDGAQIFRDSACHLRGNPFSQDGLRCDTWAHAVEFTIRWHANFFMPSQSFIVGKDASLESSIATMQGKLQVLPDVPLVDGVWEVAFGRCAMLTFNSSENLGDQRFPLCPTPAPIFFRLGESDICGRICGPAEVMGEVLVAERAGHNQVFNLMKITFNLKGYALASIAAAVLTACGGGGGSSAPAATVTAVSVPATTVALPTPTVSTPADASTAGTLETLAFVSVLTNSQENVAITGSGTTSVMTFSSPAFTVTGATSSSTTFNTGGGLVKANGNVVLFCANGKQTPSGNDTTDLSFQVAGKVFISANLVAVSDASVLAGLTIKTEDCAGVTVNTTYNTNGTSTRVDSSGTTALDVLHKLPHL